MKSAKGKTMKRNLLSELSEGFAALEAERTGKLTLRKHAVQAVNVPEITIEELVRLSEKLKLSQAV